MNALRRTLIITCAVLAAGIASTSYADRGDKGRWENERHDDNRRHERRFDHRDRYERQEARYRHGHRHYGYYDRQVVYVESRRPVYLPAPVIYAPSYPSSYPSYYPPSRPVIRISTPDIIIPF